MSQVAAIELALKKLDWKRWRPSVFVCFGEGMDRDAYDAYIRWRPSLSDTTIVFAPEGQPNVNWHNQMDGIYRWAPRDADAFVRMDADALPTRNFEDILDLVVERSAIAGTIAHYRFPARDGLSNREAWLAATAGIISEPLQFEYEYTLTPVDLSDEERLAPYYLNDGWVFFGREYFDRFAPLYLQARAKVMTQMDNPWWACQVALTMAAVQIDLPKIVLPLRYNFPNDEIAAERYPEEMRNCVVMHYLRTGEFDRQSIFESPKAYAEFMIKPLNVPNEAFRKAIVRLFGKTYPFEQEGDSTARSSKSKRVFLEKLAQLRFQGLPLRKLK